MRQLGEVLVLRIMWVGSVTDAVACIRAVCKIFEYRWSVEKMAA